MGRSLRTRLKGTIAQAEVTYGCAPKGVELYDPYSSLCQAVIRQACRDYIDYRLKYEDFVGKRKETKGYLASRKNYESAVNFLDDENLLFQMYSDGVEGASAAYLIRKMDEKVEEQKEQKKTKGRKHK